jgi:hypothetical protein
MSEERSAEWINGNGMDVIITRTRVRVRPSGQRAINFDISHEQWSAFIYAVKAGVYDLPD